MIGLPAGARIWLVAGMTDMRCGFNGLATEVQTAFPAGVCTPAHARSLSCACSRLRLTSPIGCLLCAKTQDAACLAGALASRHCRFEDEEFCGWIELALPCGLQYGKYWL